MTEIAQPPPLPTAPTPIPETPPPAEYPAAPEEEGLSEWGIFWRGSIILSLLFGAILINNIPNKTLGAAGFILLMNVIFYPFFLLGRSLWRSSLMSFVLYTVILSATPLMMSAWVLVMIFLSRCLVVRRLYWLKVTIAAAIFAGAWAYALELF